MRAMKTFRTTDLHLAAALKLFEFKLLKIEREPQSRRGVFYFQDSPDRPNMVQSFFDGSLQGSLKKYISVWADLKGLISQQMDVDPS